MKTYRLAFGIVAAGLLGFSQARGEYLFDGFLAPSFSTSYSAWDLMYSPYGGANYPDFAAPFGTYQTATAAGVTPPANSNPGNPLAFWDSRNPTITQTGSDTAFIVGPGSTGNIYSFAAPLAYQLNDPTTSATGMVLFQFQTDGSLTDFSSIKLQYTDATGHLVSLSANEMLREYQSSGSSFGGITNRTALEWNLTGLNVTSFQIVWNSATTSNSFQMASLDTTATYGSVIPASRSWNAASGLWSDGTKWKEGTSSNENGNVNFINSATGTVTLDGNHTVGQITFNTAANTTINSPGNFTLTANTGISTPATATGTYTINSKYQFGAFNIFEINAGTVKLGGAVTGSFGMEKDGNGVLSTTNSNIGPVTVNKGTLRVEAGGSITANGSVTVGTGATLLVHGSLNGTGALTLAGGTLGGSGTVNRSFTLDTGILAPGEGIGLLTTLGETWAGGGKFQLQISDVNTGVGVGWDGLNINGALSLTASSSSKFTLQLQSLASNGVAGAVFDFNSGTSYSWKFLTSTSAITGFDSAAFTIDTSGFQNTLAGSFNVTLASDGKGILLNYLAVPEPSSVFLMLAGVACLSQRRRAGGHHK